eukprot:scpid51952/ scgid0006/ 
MQCCASPDLSKNKAPLAQVLHAELPTPVTRAARHPARKGLQRGRAVSDAERQHQQILQSAFAKGVEASKGTSRNAFSKCIAVLARARVLSFFHAIIYVE